MCNQSIITRDVFEIPFPPLTFGFGWFRCEPVQRHAFFFTKQLVRGALPSCIQQASEEHASQRFSYVRYPFGKYYNCLYTHCGKWVGRRKIRVLCLGTREPRDGARRRAIPEGDCSRSALSAFISLPWPLAGVFPHVGEQPRFMAELRVNSLDCTLLTLSNQTFFTPFVTSPWSSLSSTLLHCLWFFVCLYCFYLSILFHILRAMISS